MSTILFWLFFQFQSTSSNPLHKIKKYIPSIEFGFHCWKEKTILIEGFWKQGVTSFKIWRLKLIGYKIVFVFQNWNLLFLKINTCFPHNLGNQLVVPRSRKYIRHAHQTAESWNVLVACREAHHNKVSSIHPVTECHVPKLILRSVHVFLLDLHRRMQKTFKCAPKRKSHRRSYHHVLAEP
jgi:hypothetical protein